MLLLYLLDIDRQAMLGCNGVTHRKLNPRERGRISGIGAGVTAGDEYHGDRAVFDLENGPQPHLRFRITDTTLAGYEIVHVITRQQGLETGRYLS